MEDLRLYLGQEMNIDMFPNGFAIKTEPSYSSDNFSETSSNSSYGLTCKKCSETIDERYFVVMDNKEWHINCLSCDICRKHLGHQPSCYQKDNVVFCKDCYTRAGLKTCQLCHSTILRSEFVFKCNKVYYHYECFFCTVCKYPLRTGQKFGQIDDVLYCEEHFMAAKESIEYGETASDVDSVVDYGYEYGSNLHYWDLHTRPVEMLHMDNISQNCFSYEMSQLDFMFPGTSCSMTDHFESMLTSPPMRVAVLDGKNQCKRKRARTSFRQEQLKELRKAFLVNQNPDTAELMRMAQKIGLTKRVLQVWFQNTRAKHRRCQNKEVTQTQTATMGKMQ